MCAVIGLSFRPSMPPGQFDPTRGHRKATAGDSIAAAGAASPRSADHPILNPNGDSLEMFGVGTSRRFAATQRFVGYRDKADSGSQSDRRIYEFTA